MGDWILHRSGKNRGIYTKTHGDYVCYINARIYNKKQYGYWHINKTNSYFPCTIAMAKAKDIESAKRAVNIELCKLQIT